MITGKGMALSHLALALTSLDTRLQPSPSYFALHILSYLGQNGRQSIPTLCFLKIGVILAMNLVLFLVRPRTF